MKKLALIAALASVVAMPMAANAGTATGNFTVSVAFTPSCTVATSASSIFFTYTAFAAAPATVPVSAPIVLTCSRGIGNVATSAYGENGAFGVIPTANLRYTLSTPVKTFAPGTPATGTPGGDIGTPDSLSFNFSGTLLQQPGAGTSGVPAPTATDARTFIVSF